MQDDDPVPLFPHEGFSCGMEHRLNASVQRLENCIDRLVEIFYAQQLGPPTTGSVWAGSVVGDGKTESCRESALFAQEAEDGKHEANNFLHTLASGTDGRVAPNSHTHSDDTSSCQSDNSQGTQEPGIARRKLSSRYERGYRDHLSASQMIHSKGKFARFVMSDYFDAAISLVVVFNIILFGAQVNAEAEHNHSYKFFDYLEWVCAAIFTVELSLRLWVVGLHRMCTGSERYVTLLDVVLVMTGILDVSVHIFVDGDTQVGMGAAMVRIVKVLRIGRLLRPLRTMAMLHELRVIAAMIVSSFRSLFWLMCIIFSMTFCFSLLLTQGAAAYFNSFPEGGGGSVPEEIAEIRRTYGSVLRTMYSLFLAMTGGRDWGEIAGLIANAGYFYASMVVCFVFINLFSVLNIVTGIFVDGAIELGKRDRSNMIQKQTKEREANRRHLVALLKEVDTDGDGVISKGEFFTSLEHGTVQDFMDALGIDPDNAAEVFLLLDRDGNGFVQLTEFIQGMEKLRGEARAVDMHMLHLHTRKIIDLLNHMQGIQSSLLARIPVDSRITPKRKKSRWENKGLPDVPSLSESLSHNAPGVPGVDQQ